MMSRESLEYSISQYVDGTLPDEERSALEVVLASDAEARSMLAEHQQITDLLRSAPAAPAVAWDRLAASIGMALDDVPHPVAATDRSRWVLRRWVPGGAGLALAASVLLAAGLAVHLLVGRARPSGSTGPVIRTAPVAVLNVEGPASDRPEGPQVAEVSIGPGGQYAKEPSLAPYADDIDARPSRVIIASGMNTETARPLFPD